MSFKKFFFLIFMIFAFCSLVFADSIYDITFCSPNIFSQDMGQADVNILFPESLFDPCDYKGVEYPLISFSNSKIKVISSKFSSPFFINTKISIDRGVEPKKYDLKVVSCNDKGEKKTFIKKDAITIVRKSVINDVVVKTSNGKVTRGKDANITIYGENFEKGDIRVTIVMSGVMSEIVKCRNSNVINLNLKGYVSKNILPGEYSIYILNQDGTSAVSSKKIIIE